jgi:hypothetical protein
MLRVLAFVLAFLAQAYCVHADSIGPVVGNPPTKIIDWPLSPPNVLVMRTRVSREQDLVVSILGARCSIIAWLIYWAWPLDRDAAPSFSLAAPASAQHIRSYPTQIRFSRDGAAVDDAGFATRELPDSEIGENGHSSFLMYALQNPDKIDVYLAIRGLGSRSDCGGTMSVQQMPHEALPAEPAH